MWCTGLLDNPDRYGLHWYGTVSVQGLLEA